MEICRYNSKTTTIVIKISKMTTIVIKISKVTTIVIKIRNDKSEIILQLNNFFLLYRLSRPICDMDP